MNQALIQPERAKSPAPSSGSGKKTTVGFVNLGCTKNQVDSEIMLGTLAADGFELTGNPQKAEVVIINTCGFIEEAKQESINTILEHAKLKESGACRVLIAAGCLAQRYQGDLLKELPELDGVVGTGEFGKIAGICRDLLTPKRRHQRLWISPPPYLYDEMVPRLRLGKSHSAYVKIAEGCNRNCAFCAIPLMRGKQRSRPVESIMAEVQQLAEAGVKEINLISQDTVNYGVDLGLRQGLVCLLRELVKVKALRWIRPFYLYPQQVTDELLDLYAGEERITKYIDMPLQHINSAHAQAHASARRPANDRDVGGAHQDTDPWRHLSHGLHCGISRRNRSRVRRTQAVRRAGGVRSCGGISLLGRREDTRSRVSIEKIDRSVMEERRNELLAVQEAIAAAKSMERIGSTLDVLVDGSAEEEGHWLEGRHEGLAPEIDGVVYIDGNGMDSDRSRPAGERSQCRRVCEGDDYRCHDV